MNIEITNEEYEKLLGLLYIADFVMTGHKAGEDPRTKKYEKIVQKFYARAAEMGAENKIEYDPDLRKYYPTLDFEESSEARKLMDEFADETFWHELIYRFTERDAARLAGGHEKLDLLNPDDRFELETPIEEKYLDEFEEHGIERLEIVEQFHGNGAALKTSD